MTRTTGIEWTEHTWNPFVGCTIQSPGCTHCYAMRQAHRNARMSANSVYVGTTKLANGNPVWTGQLNRGSAQTWKKPLSIKTPSLIFVNSMSDFWHPGAPHEWRREALAIMGSTPHQYQILTKVPHMIPDYFRWRRGQEGGGTLPGNVWLGVTVERSDFRHRIDELRAVAPAPAVRFLSLEPLLGPLHGLDLTGIDWVIAGGESGLKARPMDADWVRFIRDQCHRARVPFFFKQWGQPRNNPIFDEAIHLGESPADRLAQLDPNGKGGQLLDGVAHLEWPSGLQPGFR